MCGIAGFLEQNTRENRREILGRMTGSLRHARRRGDLSGGVRAFLEKRTPRGTGS